MKRFLVLAITVIFVLGLAATAMAAHLDVVGNGKAIELNGEWKLRAKAVDNLTDFDDTNPDKDNYIWQRMRFIISAVISENVKATTRWTLGDGNFNGTNDTVGTIGVDWAYLTVKKFGGTWYLGLQPASWGNKLAAWGGKADRVKYIYKASDAVTLGAVYQKDIESANDTSGGGDKDSLYVLGIFKLADAHKLGVIYKSTNDNTPNGTTTQVDSTWMDISYNGKAGPVSIAAEYATADSDAADTDKTIMFVSGSMAVGDAITVSAAYAAAADGYVADDDFGATLAAGTSANVAAIGEFGEFQGGFGLPTARDDEASAIVVAASFKASDDLTLSANIAQHTLSDTAEVDAFEIGVKASYAIADQTNLEAVYVNLAPDVPAGGSDDTITSAGLQLISKW